MLPYLEREFDFRLPGDGGELHPLLDTRHPTMRSLAERTSPDMDFSVKTHQTMTHRVPEAAAEREGSRFVGALNPLIEEGKLAAILFQFPYGFTPSSRAAIT